MTSFLQNLRGRRRWDRSVGWLAALVLALGLGGARVVLGLSSPTPHDARDYRRGVDAAEHRRFKEAISFWKRAAAAGSARAEYYIGIVYFKGLGVPKSYVRAVEWYRKAAAAGYAHAAGSLGLMYERGLGVGLDYGKALAWFRMAAAHGDAFSAANIGYLYAHGLGGRRDYGKAMIWLKRASAAGDAKAMYGVGSLYSRGLGVPRNYRKAIIWWKRAAAAGDAEAMYGLGSLYFGGLGTRRNYAKAMVWFRKAAAGGNAMAMYGIGTLYDRGLGVTRSRPAALEWWRRAAALGSGEARAALLTSGRDWGRTGSAFRIALIFFVAASVVSVAAFALLRWRRQRVGAVPRPTQKASFVRSPVLIFGVGGFVVLLAGVFSAISPLAMAGMLSLAVALVAFFVRVLKRARRGGR